MPARRLNANTVVRNPETHLVVRLKAGDKVPDWASDQVGDHLFDEVQPVTAPPVEPPVKDEKPSGEPPRAGAGSGLEAWTEHAKSLDIEVPQDATRTEVIALVDARNA